jgi:hypothetical protein
MAKNLGWVAAGAVFLLLSSVVVFAAGGGGGGSTKTSGTSSSTGSGSSGTTISSAPQPVDCETLSTLQSRITCRLENGNDGKTVEESCRVLSNKQECQALYANAEPCYGMSGKEKDKCFKKVAQFQHVSLRQQGEVSTQPIRTYLVLLLYDLQERVEERRAAGELTAEEASILIAEIIETKQALMLNKSRAEIQSRLAQLKNDWKVRMA